MSQPEKKNKPSHMYTENLIMQELNSSFPSIPPKAEQNPNPSIQAAFQRLIQFHNPLLAEMAIRANLLKRNNFQEIADSIEKKVLNTQIYEQYVLADLVTEGIASWGEQEIVGRIQTQSSDFNSKHFHDDYVNRQLKRFSIFEGNKELLQGIPLKALEFFPDSKRQYFDFFSIHAIFCSTDQLIGHSAVNDILQPLLIDHSVDDSLQLMIKNPPQSLTELFDPALQHAILS